MDLKSPILGSLRSGYFDHFVIITFQNDKSECVMKIDEIDRGMIKFLRHNARMSITELASQLQISRVTAKSRLASLQKHGVIRKFTIETDLGHDEGTIRAVSMFEVDGTKSQQVQRTLARMPEIEHLHTTNGTWAMVAYSQTPNLSAFDHLLFRFGEIGGVKNVETCLLLRRLV